MSGATVGRGLVIKTNNDGGVGDDTVIYNATQSTGSHVFEVNSTERLRIDSSGRLLVGATSVIGDSTEDAYYAKIVVRGNTASVNNSGQIALCTGAGIATLTSGERIGRVVFVSTATVALLVLSIA